MQLPGTARQANLGSHCLGFTPYNLKGTQILPLGHSPVIYQQSEILTTTSSREVWWSKPRWSKWHSPTCAMSLLTSEGWYLCIYDICMKLLPWLWMFQHWIAVGGEEQQKWASELVVSSVFFLFAPKPWGFMIQFDERAHVSNGLVKNQQRDNELLVAILSIILSGVTLILIWSGSEIFGKKTDLPILDTPQNLTGRPWKMMVARLPSFGKASVQRRTVRLPGRNWPMFFFLLN